MLADYGSIVPDETDQPQFPVGDRDYTEQTSVFQFLGGDGTMPTDSRRIL